MRFVFFIAATALLFGCRENRKYDHWEVTGGTKEGIRYSTLDQFTLANVKNLQVAWEYKTGDADIANHSQMQCNPIVVDGVLYATSPQLKLLALDAATGKEKWVFDPKKPGDKRTQLDFILNNNRGVTYWTDGTAQRIFYVVGSWLHAVDAKTGSLVNSFGNNGRIDLHDGLGRDVSHLYVAATSPGIIYQDLLIMGSRVSEGTDAAPGHIRAYDVRTGEQRWIFHTIPQPGEFGHDTWDDPEAYKYIGGANAWSGFTMDEARGIVFVPTGSASFDFYGGKRKGTGLFSNCILALNAATGERIWHYQYLHHDVWDRDLPTPPALVTLKKDEKDVDAIAQPTKHGYIFILDRQTGEPLYEINEEPVPTETDAEGEVLWPTQPIPVFPEPFARQTFTEADLNHLLPDSSFNEIRERYRKYKKGHLFTPPSREGTIFFPGLDGGAEWGGPAFDPETGIMYVNANEVPWIITLVDVKRDNASKRTYLSAGEDLYKRNCQSCHGASMQGGGNNPTLIGVEKKYSLKTFTDLVSTGRRMMPAFAHLSEQQRDAIASYVLKLDELQRKDFISDDQSADPSEVPYTISGYNKFVSKENYPAISPPWGSLSAVNLHTGKIEWKITLGEDEYFLKKGIVTGTENYGGPVVTSTGLLFIAATRDSKIRAFNKSNGELVWEYKLPAPGFATPAMYSVDGKQYLVVTCGGGKLGTTSGDSYIAFSLP